MKNEIMPKSAAFVSQVDRVISDPVLQHSPPVGSYDPGLFVHMDKTKELKNGKTFLLMRHEKPKVVPFLSEVKRLSELNTTNNA